MIPKSRFGSVDSYLASDKYNDIPIQCEPDVLKELLDEGGAKKIQNLLLIKEGTVSSRC